MPEGSGEVEVGRVDLIVKTDGRSTEDSHRRGGKAAGKEFSREFQVAVDRVTSRLLGPAAGKRVGRLAGLLTGTRASAAPAAAAGARGAAGAAAAGGAATGATTGAGAAAASAAVPVVGIVVAALAVAAASTMAFAKVLQKASEHVARATRDLSAVSPLLAGVRARERIGELRRNILRARAIGPQLERIAAREEFIRDISARVDRRMEQLGLAAFENIGLHIKHGFAIVTNVAKESILETLATGSPVAGILNAILLAIKDITGHNATNSANDIFRQDIIRLTQGGGFLTRDFDAGSNQFLIDEAFETDPTRRSSITERNRIIEERRGKQ